MYHGAESGFALIPVAAVFVCQAYGLCRAEVRAYSASFAAQRVDAIAAFREYVCGMEGAELFAGAAADAVFLLYNGFMPGNEGSFSENFWFEQNVEIWSVYIQIADDLVLGQVSERSADGGFSRSALTADDDYFTHEAPPYVPWKKPQGHRAAFQTGFSRKGRGLPEAFRRNTAVRLRG